MFVGMWVNLTSNFNEIKQIAKIGREEVVSICHTVMTNSQNLKKSLRAIMNKYTSEKLQALL